MAKNTQSPSQTKTSHQRHEHSSLEMTYFSGLKFLFFGIVLTIADDIYLSSSSWFLIILASIRLIGMSIALVYRMIFDYDQKNTHQDLSMTFWNSLKSTFLVMAGLQQAFVLYQWAWPLHLWSSIGLVARLIMPFIAYLWIRRIQAEDLSYLQEVCLGTNDRKLPSGRRLTKLLLSIPARDRSSAPTADQSMALQRLFRYSRTDLETLVFGTLLLLGTAICRCFFACL